LYLMRTACRKNKNQARKTAKFKAQRIHPKACNTFPRSVESNSEKVQLVLTPILK